MCTWAPGSPPGLRRQRRNNLLALLGAFVMGLWLAQAARGQPLERRPSVDPIPTTRPAHPQNAPEPTGKPASHEDELLIFQDVPVVISAARRAQPSNWLSVPVSTITAEDIHYSGSTNLPEILQFVPGMDVLRLERGRYAVGVRGWHDFIADRTLTLVDGRPADSPLFGGSEFYRLPILLEDIKRVEVVRGPGGAVWGANAFTGAINIITKEPEDCLGYLASTTWSDVGDSYNHLRWAAKSGKWSWMTSVGYNETRSSEKALGNVSFVSSVPAINSLMGFDSFSARDYARNWVFDGKAIYRPSGRSKLTLGTAASEHTGGSYELGGYYPRDNSHLQTVRSFARVDANSAEGTSGYLQWFGNFSRTNNAMATTFETRENDLEAQYNLTVAERHQVSVGGNLRWINANNSSQGQQVVFPGTPYNEYWAGLFVMDRWHVSDRLILEGQVRGDWYSETQTDLSARISALVALDARKRHVLRLSGARAFRSPLASLRKSRMARMPLPPPVPAGLYAFNVLPAHGLKNEETLSVELGYTGKLTNWLSLQANTYYQRFDRLIGYQYSTDPFGLSRIFCRAKNLDGADAWGGEVELAVENKVGKLSAWYAYNAAHRDSGNPTRSYLPAPHKLGLTGRLFLPGDLTLNANFRFATATPVALNRSTEARSSNQLDLSVAKKVLKGAGEIMVGVQDVLNDRRDPVYGTAGFTAHETPGRTFFIRFQMKF